MLCKSITVLAVAGLASAATPPGFQPGAKTELIVMYNGVQAQSGSVVARAGKLFSFVLFFFTTTTLSRGEQSTPN
jgi:hypothetical protein